MADKNLHLLTQSERAAYQAMVARGVSHADAIEDALDGVDVQTVRSADHGPDSMWFVPGAWPGCTCGYRPKDNAKLTKHWADFGFRVRDEHGTLRKVPL